MVSGVFPHTIVGQCIPCCCSVCPPFFGGQLELCIHIKDQQRSAEEEGRELMEDCKELEGSQL